MPFSLYTEPFDNVCQIVIPGAVHQYQALRPEDITCTSGDGSTVISPVHLAIDPLTQDVTITFAIPHTGTVDIAGASRLPRVRWPDDKLLTAQQYIRNAFRKPH
jgi:hypothetical protein